MRARLKIWLTTLEYEHPTKVINVTLVVHTLWLAFMLASPWLIPWKWIAAVGAAVAALNIYYRGCPITKWEYGLRRKHLGHRGRGQSLMRRLLALVGLKLTERQVGYITSGMLLILPILGYLREVGVLALVWETVKALLSLWR